MTRLVKPDGKIRGEPLYKDLVGRYYMSGWFEDEVRGVSFPILIPCNYFGDIRAGEPSISSFVIITKEIEQAHGWHGRHDPVAACVLCDAAGWVKKWS